MGPYGPPEGCACAECAASSRQGINKAHLFRNGNFWSRESMMGRADSTTSRALASAALLLALSAPAPAAVGDERFVLFAEAPRAFRLVSRGLAAPILIDPDDLAGVRRAGGDLQEDVGRVTGVRPEILARAPARAGDVVVIGTLGHSRLLDELV